MRTFLNALLRALSCGYILFYFSELMFWARLRPEDSLGNWVQTWLAYSLAAFAFMAVVQRFKVRSLPALFLAGAFYGWLLEGVIVQTLYDSFPLQIAWTGLAWHALISVLWGWYAIRRAMHSANWRSLLTLCILLGLFYGLWSICWWVEPDPLPVQPDILMFLLFTGISTLLLIPAYAVYDLTMKNVFNPPNWLLWVTGILFTGLFLLAAILTVPLAFAVLPPLLLVLYLALRRNARVETSDDLVNDLRGPVQPVMYLGLLLIPLAALTVYSLSAALGLRLFTNQLVYLVSVPLGFGLFLWALVKTWRSVPWTKTEK